VETWFSPMEEPSHRTHESQLKSAIFVKSICVRNPQSKTSFFCHRFYFVYESVSITNNFLLKSFKVFRNQTDIWVCFNLLTMLAPFFTHLIFK
jgi:hypothetical protein